MDLRRLAWVASLALAAGLGGCTREPAAGVVDTTRYTAVVQCNGCERRYVELELSQQADARPAGYRRREAGVGESRGTWRVARSASSDDERDILELDDDTATGGRRLLSRGDNEVIESASGAKLYRVITLGEQDDGRSVRIEIGQELEVRLPVDRQGGSAWRLTPVPYPSLAAQPGGSQAPGEQLFRFRGERSGTQPLTFTRDDGRALSIMIAATPALVVSPP